MQRELELVETDELLNEVFARFDHAIFSGMKITAEADDGSSDCYMHRHWKGNTLTGAGMAQDLGVKMIDTFEARSEDYEDDEG